MNIEDTFERATGLSRPQDYKDRASPRGGWVSLESLFHAFIHSLLLLFLQEQFLTYMNEAESENTIKFAGIIRSGLLGICWLVFWCAAAVLPTAPPASTQTPPSASLTPGRVHEWFLVTCATSLPTALTAVGAGGVKVPRD